MKEYDLYTDSYFRKLLPFYLISVLIHAIVLGGTFAYSAVTSGSDEFSTTSFSAGTESDIQKRGGDPQAGDADKKPVRQKIYRVDYFPTLLLETPIKDKPPVITVKPEPLVKPEVKPAIKKPVTKPNNVEPEPPELPLNPAGRIYTAEELGTNGGVLPFPTFNFTMIPYNEKKWLSFNSINCQGYDIVYVVVDISQKQGFEDYFDWLLFWDNLLSMEGVQDPPTPVGIAEIINDPYSITPQMASDAIKRRLDSLDFKAPVYKNYNFIDPEGQILHGLNITSLEYPQVYLVDYQGFVRLKLEGRIADIPMDQIRKAVGVIKQLWGMNDVEAALATAAIMSYQQKLTQEKAALDKPVQ